MHLLCLFLGILDSIDILRDTFCITVVVEHLGGEINNIKRVETASTQLGIIHELLGGDVGVDGIGIPEHAYPCVLDGVDDEGVTAAFGSFVQI